MCVCVRACVRVLCSLVVVRGFPIVVCTPLMTKRSSSQKHTADLQPGFGSHYKLTKINTVHHIRWKSNKKIVMVLHNFTSSTAKAKAHASISKINLPCPSKWYHCSMGLQQASIVSWEMPEHCYYFQNFPEPRRSRGQHREWQTASQPCFFESRSKLLSKFRGYAHAYAVPQLPLNSLSDWQTFLRASSTGSTLNKVTGCLDWESRSIRGFVTADVACTQYILIHYSWPFAGVCVSWCVCVCPGVCALCDSVWECVCVCVCVWVWARAYQARHGVSVCGRFSGVWLASPRHEYPEWVCVPVSWLESQCLSVTEWMNEWINFILWG